LLRRKRQETNYGLTMPLPIAPTNTCDIYRVGTTPPASPAVSGVPCVLQNDWRGGQGGRDRTSGTLTWTHLLLVDITVDIRDAYTGNSTLSPQDTVYIPDSTGTAYNVIFVEVIDAVAANAYKRCYLDRQTPDWSGLAEGGGPILI
jgi:hypothetical protein